jgi:hypothetical protein
MNPKRLVILVEGDGDETAVPALIGKMLAERRGSDALFVDGNVMPTGGATKLVTQKAIVDRNWERWLGVALKRPNLGAVLLLADGDMDQVAKGKPFCPGRCALGLSERARTVGAGVTFSVASVFARQEYESWLIAGVRSLAGKELPNSLGRIAADVTPPNGDLEVAPRGAKKWLSQHAGIAYKPTIHQAVLTRLVDLLQVRQRNLRSFQRLEKSLQALIEAIRNGKHIVLP